MHELLCSAMYSLSKKRRSLFSSQATTLPSRPPHPQFFFCFHNVFDAASFFQASYVVHWNAPPDNFFVWRHDVFVYLHDVYSQRVYLQGESLLCFLAIIKLSVWLVFMSWRWNMIRDQDKFWVVFLRDIQHDKLLSWR